MRALLLPSAKRREWSAMNGNDVTPRVARHDARRVLAMLRRYRVAESDMLTRARRSLGMSENEFAALRFLMQQRDHAARPHALIQHLGISSASVTAMIDKLERTGRIVRHEVAGDRRAVSVTATPLAKREMRTTFEELDELMEAAVERLSPSEINHIEAFLEVVTDAVEGSIAA